MNQGCVCEPVVCCTHFKTALKPCNLTAVDIRILLNLPNAIEHGDTTTAYVNKVASDIMVVTVRFL